MTASEDIVSALRLLPQALQALKDQMGLTEYLGGKISCSQAKQHHLLTTMASFVVIWNDFTAVPTGGNGLVIREGIVRRFSCVSESVSSRCFGHRSTERRSRNAGGSAEDSAGVNSDVHGHRRCNKSLRNWFNRQRRSQSWLALQANTRASSEESEGRG